MLTIADWVQIASTVVTATGVLASLYIGVANIFEIKRQREQAIEPFLLFDIGGHIVPVEYRDSSAIPGINPEHARQLTKGRPKGPNSMEAKTMWGTLRNHGQGAALDARITFHAYRVFTSFGCRVLDASERKAFPYSRGLNRIPSTPSNLSPAGKGEFRRLPTPLVVDYDRAIKRIDYVLQIECKDVLGNKHIQFQGLRLFCDKNEEVGDKITMTFIEELSSPATWIVFGQPESPEYEFSKEIDS